MHLVVLFERGLLKATVVSHFKKLISLSKNQIIYLCFCTLISLVGTNGIETESQGREVRIYRAQEKEVA